MSQVMLEALACRMLLGELMKRHLLGTGQDDFGQPHQRQLHKMLIERRALLVCSGC